MGQTRKKGNIFTNIVDTVDIFNGPVQLTLNNKTSLQTTLGGGLTIALVIFILYQTSFAYVDMVNHEGPQLYQINELEEDPALVTLSRANNFFMALLIQYGDGYQNLSNSSSFSFDITYNEYYRSDNQERTKAKYPILWAPCNESDFPADIYGPNVFSTYSFQYAYCPTGINFKMNGTCPDEILKKYPDCIAPPTFEILGTYFSGEFDLIQFNIRVCENDPKMIYNLQCGTGDLYAKILQVEHKVNLFFANTLTKPTSYKSPNRTLVDSNYWTPNPKIYKVADVFVDRVTIQDFDSYFSTSVSHNTTLFAIQSDKIRELEVIEAVASSDMMQINIRRSNLNVVVSRTYTKFQDFLTDLGGFSKALMFICGFVAIGFVRYKYNVILANQLYDFKIPSKSDKKNRPQDMLFSLEFSETRGLYAESPISPQSLGDGTQSKVIKDYFDGQNNSRKKLHEGAFQYFKNVSKLALFMRNPEEVLGRKARTLVQNDLDVIKLIKKLQEVDTIKSLIMDQTQLEAFNFMEKPLITQFSRRAIHHETVVEASRSSRLLESGRHAKPDGNWTSLMDLMKQKKLEAINETPKKQKKETKETLSHDPVFYKYGKLYMAYRFLEDDTDPSNQVFNKKLLKMLNPDLLQVFKRADELLGPRVSPKQFEELVKESMKDTCEILPHY